MSTISLEVRVDKRIDIEVELHDVIDALNNLPLTNRWNYVVSILNNVTLDINDLNVDQKDIIKSYLEKRMSLFNQSNQKEG